MVTVKPSTTPAKKSKPSVDELEIGHKNTDAPEWRVDAKGDK